MANYSIKNLKTFTGMEGPGFEASFYADGKKVGSVFDAGDGGEILFRIPADVGKAYTRYAMELIGDEGYGNSFAEGFARDAVLCKMVDDFEHVQWLKRQCRNKVLFRVDGDDEDSWRTLKGKWSGAAAKYLDEKYPNAIVANRDLI